jgi:hypothetical protein
MILVPKEYLKDCVHEDTPFGKYVKSYYYKEKVKRSKLEDFLCNEKNKKQFQKLTKLDFINEFILNDNYVLEDFLNISNISTRGFIYEALWDIVIKCNIVNELSSNHMMHLEGKIEELRDTKRHFMNDLDKLKPIENIYKYFQNTKFISFSSSGVSDITLSSKTNSNHYILISCKFYLNEKNIEEYDLAKLCQVMKNTEKTFDIILLVNDKFSLERKIQKSTKTEVKESIYRIYDKMDLAFYYEQLKRFFSYIHHFHQHQNISQYFMAKNYKPLMPVDFGILLFYYTCLASDTKEIQCHSYFKVHIYFCIMFNIFMNKNKEHLIIYKYDEKSGFEECCAKYYGFSKTYGLNIKFVKDITKIKQNNINFVYVFGTEKDFKTNNISFDKTIYFNNEINKPDYKWSVKNILQLEHKSWFSNNSTYFKQIVIEQSLIKLYGLDFISKTEMNNDLNKNFQKICKDQSSKYSKNLGRFIIITSKYYDEPTKESLTDYIFAKRSTIHEKYIILNRIKTIGKDFKKILWIIPEDENRVVLEEHIKTKPWLKTNYTLYITTFKSITNIIQPEIIICSDLKISFERLYEYIHAQYEKNNKDLILIEFSQERANRFKTEFAELAEDVIDIDL